MSVHRKDNRWTVRWREDGRQRAKSFPTKRAATEFDRAIRDSERMRRDREFLTELFERVESGDDPAQIRDLARGVRTFADGYREDTSERGLRIANLAHRFAAELEQRAEEVEKR